MAWTADRRSYLVDALYLGGDTDNPNAPVFERLRAETIDRRFPDAFGGGAADRCARRGCRLPAAHRRAWVRSNQTLHYDTGRDLVFAGKGEDGWGRPALGQPKLVDIDVAGQKIRQGCKALADRHLPLKAQVYTMLGKDRVASDFANVPHGYTAISGMGRSGIFPAAHR